MIIKIDASQARPGVPENPSTDAERLVAAAARIHRSDEAIAHVAGARLIWFAVSGGLFPESPDDALTLVFECADGSGLALEIAPGKGIMFVSCEKPRVN